ncbi:MAG: methylmalonyl Co-A mutase-associated GTPase MeaB [Selenomonas sp.]|uniref:methylmalonyl Co-A mutase-associated GTPase MeaB n=1 Tax=Anaerovibrio sp. TaxID=1872532 RepID=UPI0025C528EF|nr:methylmalonyl Co-A mutase-associated GTPase MeaB [Anaerovibrio sp.]MBE6099618.1 methylmalonyl Co-A mutase-associated GTPase MeaB [Anaerovibrio sp.]MBQ3853730.1 methylmalonyl Co-A mutase-associated GTPase MeaB [Anaerovibrio sp.]MBQ5503419.1 methylmalonyl Co-A mutase-associated GTPase MeaB [Selenomonas sp.]
MAKYSTSKPSWVPDEPNEKFACSVMGGIEGIKDTTVGNINPNLLNGKIKPKRRLVLSEDDYVNGVLKGDRMTLSRAITLIESNSSKHFAKAQRVLQRLLPHTGKALRIGITGVPGAGKSTIIEALGNMLCDEGHKVAVLSIDPTSSVTKGSILGDKTRMGTLSRRPEAFIRPSPAGGTLGGVARKSRETMLMCEAAGYDIILIETVGVGQSETTVRSMVDFFMLVVLTGAGDDLQGIKKGIMELADAIVINKADGDNLLKAKVARAEYERMIEYIRPATEGWPTHAYLCSAYTKFGLPELWKVIQAFKEMTNESGVFQKRRRGQLLNWMHSMIDEHLHSLFFDDPVITGRMPEVKEAVLNGTISPTQAVKELVNMFDVDKAARRQVDIFHPEAEGKE